MIYYSLQSTTSKMSQKILYFSLFISNSEENCSFLKNNLLKCYRIYATFIQNKAENEEKYAILS